ncbi:hypothetical protein L210DRAFT_3548108 [Boletus edulis BED1]|uniref:Uncharacterized protein n=1 Tax=Boletus edulis BED1 TaxID=1328754 RepID=A0AAD4BP39_BOLED|nr:hypothetical protein L210DRAFT_3548108 [Boletus edulis BED1]
MLHGILLNACICSWCFSPHIPLFLYWPRFATGDRQILFVTGPLAYITWLVYPFKNGSEC